MWIKGNISLTTAISGKELFEKFPAKEATLSEGKIHIETNRIPFFADHKLILNVHNRTLYYRLSVPSLGPLIFFLYLAVIFLAGFSNWKMLVVGSIIVTGIAFAIYVINDKGARNYIQKHISNLETEEELAEIINPLKKGSCPACGFNNSPYTKHCSSCGLRLKSKKMKNMENHTGDQGVKLTYTIKK
jgi:ribosomal protein L37E